MGISAGLGSNDFAPGSSQRLPSTVPVAAIPQSKTPLEPMPVPRLKADNPAF